MIILEYFVLSFEESDQKKALLVGVGDACLLQFSFKTLDSLEDGIFEESIMFVSPSILRISHVA